jgi:hypothetical protein
MNKKKLTEKAILNKLEKELKKAVLELARIHKRENPEDGGTLEDYKEGAAQVIEEHIQYSFDY